MVVSLSLCLANDATLFKEILLNGSSVVEGVGREGGREGVGEKPDFNNREMILL